MKRTMAVGTAAVLALAVAGCGSGSTGSAPASGTGAAKGGSTLTVYAAASLTEAFNKLKGDFEKAHPGVKVNMDYGGSSTLVQQITNGAPADVFASADQTNMNKLVKAGDNAGTPSIFASNTLEIATAPGNPKHIATFADLAKPDLSVVICAKQVPCGSATDKLEKSTKVTIKPKSEEQDVKSVLAKVRSGDADAGVVYVSDVKTAGPQIGGVNFPESKSAVNQYPAVVVKNSKNAALAQQFVAMLTAASGQKTLTDAGFTGK